MYLYIYIYIYMYIYLYLFVHICVLYIYELYGRRERVRISILARTLKRFLRVPQHREQYHAAPQNRFSGTLIRCRWDETRTCHVAPSC